MTDIILERDEVPNVMKLDSDEQALFEEIEISTERAIPKRKPPKRKQQQRRMMEADPTDELEAFTNPVKMSAPQRPPPEVTDFDDGQEEEMDMQGVESESEAKEKKNVSVF